MTMIVRIMAWPLRLFFLLLRDINDILVALSTAPFRKPYIREGECKRRGVCCRNIAVYLSTGFWKRPWLKQLVIAWYEFVYKFKWMADDAEIKVLLFRCRYLKNNGCSIYWRRPYICRTYPSGRFFAKPGVLPGCGYSFKKRS